MCESCKWAVVWVSTDKAPVPFKHVECHKGGTFQKRATAPCDELVSGLDKWAPVFREVVKDE